MEQYGRPNMEQSIESKKGAYEVRNEVEGRRKLDEREGGLCTF